MSKTTKCQALTAGSLNLIAINTVVPLLYAYGQTHGNDKYCERALQFLEPIKAENNYITRQWAECGIKVDNASDSQALIQLKKSIATGNIACIAASVMSF